MREYSKSLKDYGPRDIPKFKITNQNVKISEALGLMLDDDEDESSLFKPDGHTPLTEYCYKCGQVAHSGLRCPRSSSEGGGNGGF